MQEPFDHADNKALQGSLVRYVLSALRLALHISVPVRARVLIKSACIQLKIGKRKKKRVRRKQTEKEVPVLKINGKS